MRIARVPRRRRCATDGGRRCSLAEHFGVEPPDASASTPGVGREPRLEARLLQELVDRPAALGRHLRQEQAAPMSVLGDQAVTTDHDRARRRPGPPTPAAPAPRPRARAPAAPAASPGRSEDPLLAASAAQRATSSASWPCDSSVPRQPRSSSPRLIVTNTPDAAGRSIAAGGRAADHRPPARSLRRGRVEERFFLRGSQHEIVSQLSAVNVQFRRQVFRSGFASAAGDVRR